MKDVTEILLGAIGLVMSAFGIAFAQGDPGSFIEVIPQYGSLSVVIALVWYHTTIATPKMHSDYRLERDTLMAMHRSEINSNRADFMKALERTECKYMSRMDEQAKVKNQ